MTKVKDFKSALLRDMQEKLKEWEIGLNEGGDISVNIGSEGNLKAVFDLSPTILWMIIAEIPYQSEPVSVWFTSERCKESYCYKF